MLLTLLLEFTKTLRKIIFYASSGTRYHIFKGLKTKKYRKFLQKIQYSKNYLRLRAYLDDSTEFRDRNFNVDKICLDFNTHSGNHLKKLRRLAAFLIWKHETISVGE